MGLYRFAPALCLAVLVAPSAHGFPELRGSISGEYDNYSAGGAEANAGRGAADVTLNLFDTPLGFLGGSANARYTNLDFGGGGSLQSWDFGAAGFLRLPMGRVGASAMHARITPNPGTVTNANSYGLFGELYLSNDLTIMAKGGMFNGTGAFDGSYYGAGAKFYVTPNWSIGARVDRTEFDGVGELTDYSVNAEYLISWDVPVSLYGGYTYADAGAGPHLNLWTIGLKFRFGGDNDALSLHDRAGSYDDPYMPLKSVLAL